MSATLQILPQQLVFGLVQGSMYGLIALGYTLVYGILFMINFAHGDVFMIGAFLGWGVLTTLQTFQVGTLQFAWWVLPSMLVPAMVGAGLIGLCLERFAYRPLYRRGATRLGPLISAIGASLFLQNAVMLTQGAGVKVVMTGLLFPRSWRFQVFGVSISGLILVIVAVALLMMVGLDLLVRRTTIGRSMRAVAEDREIATIMGVNVWRVIAATFLLGSALAAVAGVLLGLYYTQIDFFMGYTAGLKAFTAAVLGGIGNVRGAMLGGLVLGIVESMAVTFMDPAYQDVIAYGVLIAILALKPSGLLGQVVPDDEKV